MNLVVEVTRKITEIRDSEYFEQTLKLREKSETSVTTVPFTSVDVLSDAFPIRLHLRE